MNYKSYPTKKDTPSRKVRKGERNSTFIYNMTLKRKANRAKRKEKYEN
jgi:hypothetical protein